MGCYYEVRLCLSAGRPAWLITSRPTHEIRMQKFRRQNPGAQNPGPMQMRADSRLRRLWLLTHALFKVQKSR